MLFPSSTLINYIYPGYEIQTACEVQPLTVDPKGEIYESPLYRCHPFSVGDRGHGIEQRRAFLRSTAEFNGAGCGKESGGGKGRLPPFLRFTAKPRRDEAEKGRPIRQIGRAH